MPSCLRRAFTLTELLIVIAIIVIVMAAAVPAFRFITGSRSTEIAQTQIAAMLSRARAYAMATQRPAGLAFFYDAASGRTTTAIVADGAASATDEDPYDNYKGWASGINYKTGQYVIAVVNDPNEIPVEGNPPTGKFVTRRFSCKQDHTSAAVNYPPAAGNTYWEKIGAGSMDVVPGAAGEFQPLPPGVAVQLLNDQKGNSSVDRYVRTGVIMFDAQGQLQCRSVTISMTSTIAKRLAPGATAGTSALLVDLNMNSQIGVVLYDKESFLGGGGLEGDWKYTPTSTTPTGIPTLSDPTTQAEEIAEEQWLDENAMLLLVNRYNGTLVKGE